MRLSVVAVSASWGLAVADQCCYSECGSSGCNSPTSWCSQSQTNCEGSCKGHFCPAGPGPAPGPAPGPSPPSPSPGTRTAGGSHFWDCSGMGCDAGTLQPWDPSKYKATAAYAPMDPAEHGGAVYGEKMWMVGAASDALSAVLGPNDPCCGAHQEGGCGKCVLISVGDAVHSDWTAVVMKKSQCPPNSHGCNVPHLDLAVPGYDNLQYSTANTCGSDHTTCNKAQSSVCGTWYNHGSSTIEGCDCSSLPEGSMRKGCELFTSWGWTRGDPTLNWKPVDCPAALKEIIHGSFGPSGPRMSLHMNSTVAEGGRCCYSECGSAGCNGPTEWCSQSQQNCEGSCHGHFCPAGPSPAPAPQPSPTPPSPPAPTPSTQTAGGSHFWDCSGMGCDAGTLQPWDPSKYKATAAYAPMDPAEHGGAVYGEKMWMVGAASDALSAVLGPNDPCCGSHQEGGCGKCVLISVDDAVHSDWTAVVMKKSQCPPNSYGCNVPHLDLAVPGYDNLQYSTANTCGSDHTTCSRQQSSVCGTWYNHGSSTIEGCDCSSLPAGQMRKGCELFTSWGWKRGDPTLHWKPVECPAALKQVIHDSFGPSGPNGRFASNATQEFATIVI